MRKTRVSQIPKMVGQPITIFGRAITIRDHGKVFFVDVADETGIVQTVSRQKYQISEGDILKIAGLVKKRPENLVNINIETGQVEIEIEKLEIISNSLTPPIPTEGDGYDIEENLRLKYRYLDLRRPRLQKNLRLRHRLTQLVREFLNSEEFVEIETPYLSQTTPEGARDFLVPSRLNKGKFYALAQSPQQYKQMLMLSGFEKYYQFARAFRDEDLRADRQFEHTQIDIEMAFVAREDILDLVERLFKSLSISLDKKILQDPFPNFTYKEAIEKFGADKFDLRKTSNDQSLAFAWIVDFPLLEFDKAEKRFTFSHNPFTSPKEKDTPDLMNSKNLDKILSYQYDLVLNGQEIGSGSIRITDPKIQKQVFKVMGYTDKKIAADFGHLLKAYEFGAPVHGGIALGLDRICAIITGEKSIREVIAFPISGTGNTSVMEAPSPVGPQTLKDLNLKIS